MNEITRYCLIFVCSLVSTFLLCLLLIKVLKNKKASVVNKPELLVQNEQKAKTPQFGGVAIILALYITYGLLIKKHSSISACLLGALVYAIAGLVDDVLKTKSTNGDGFTVKQKFASQLVCTFICICLLFLYAYDFTSLLGIELGYFYAIPCAIYILYFVNAYNITDGLDGLATLTSIPVLIIITIIALLKNSELSSLAIALIGSLCGFLILNFKPAKIFMGDVGSHAIGTLIAMMAVFLKVEFVILFAGFIYLIEFLSSLLQIISIRTRNKKILPIAPLHHSLEYYKYSELKIVFLFTLVNLIASVASFGVYCLCHK